MQKRNEGLAGTVFLCSEGVCVTEREREEYEAKCSFLLVLSHYSTTADEIRATRFLLSFAVERRRKRPEESLRQMLCPSASDGRNFLANRRFFCSVS